MLLEIILYILTDQKLLLYLTQKSEFFDLQLNKNHFIG